MSKVSINVSTLTAIGDAIREKTGKTDLIAPGAMPEEIAAIETGGGGIEVEPIVFTGNCASKCTGMLAGKYIDLHGDTITTDNITNCKGMFSACGAKNIPFELNLNTTSAESLFENAEITSVPVINFLTSYFTVTQKMFSGCKYLKSIPDDFAESIPWGTPTASTGRQSTLNGCSSLRYVSPKFLKDLCSGPQTSATYSPYYYLATGTSVLDELKGIGVGTGTITSNVVGGILSGGYRLKSLTFDVNEDGTAKTANWKSQTINLTVTGSTTNASYVTNYGITEDKLVSDDASYQALKNDPDWFTTNVKYSRYNHDSAVETINSLPDTSAYLATSGGTNTIKFKGEAGSATDGGAINTLTEEEIAVAAAKGWTVTLS